MRKVVQIAGTESKGMASLYALCDDGTMWCAFSDSGSFGGWVSVSSIPQDDFSDEPIEKEVRANSAAVYSVDEVASFLGVCRATAYNAVKTGQIPSFKLGDRILVPKEAFHKLLDVGLTI